MQEQLQQLRNLATRAENRRTETGIPRVAMVQGEIPEHQQAVVYQPMVNLILTGSKTMTVGIAFGVGYESPNQFSREYPRHFGLPPLKHAARLRLQAG